MGGGGRGGGLDTSDVNFPNDPVSERFSKFGSFRATRGESFIIRWQFRILGAGVRLASLKRAVAKFCF